jgi:hypothetical protein
LCVGDTSEHNQLLTSLCLCLPNFHFAAKAGGSHAARQAATDSFSRPAATSGLGSPRGSGMAQQLWPGAAAAMQPGDLQLQQQQQPQGWLQHAFPPAHQAAAPVAGVELPAAALAAFGLVPPGLPPQ